MKLKMVMACSDCGKPVKITDWFYLKDELFLCFSCYEKGEDE